MRANRKFHKFLAERRLTLIVYQPRCIDALSSRACFVYFPYGKTYDMPALAETLVNMRQHLVDLNDTRMQMAMRKPFIAEFKVAEIDKTKVVDFGMSDIRDCIDCYGTIFVFRDVKEAIYFKLKFIG